MTFRAMARGALHRTLRCFGLELVRYDVARFPELRRPKLLQERRIGLVLDGGANEGQYADVLRRWGYEGRIVSFEPLSAARHELERRAAGDTRWETLPYALGQATGSCAFHVAGNSRSSSLLPMTSRHIAGAPASAYVAEEQVEVRRLDDLSGDFLRPEDRVWLKLDVQGYELPALRGAERTLAQVEVVECELSLVELYEGQGLLEDVRAHLDARGFGLWSIEPLFRHAATGEVLQLDGVFVRRD